MTVTIGILADIIEAWADWDENRPAKGRTARPRPDFPALVEELRLEVDGRREGGR